MSRGPWCKTDEERKERQRASFERCVAKDEARYRQLAKERSKRLYKLRKELLGKISRLNSTQLKAIVEAYCGDEMLEIAKGLAPNIGESYYQGLVAGVREMMEMEENEARDATMDDLDPFLELDAPTKTSRLTASEARSLGKLRGLLVGYGARFGEEPPDEEPLPRSKRKR